MTFTLPGPTDRTTIIGRTGSGKTWGALWLLSQAPFHTMPYVIVDGKEDENIGSIARARDIGYTDVPRRPGLYRLRPQPGEEMQLEQWMASVWERRGIGLYFDEMYLVPAGPRMSALRRLLVTGRSRQIPMIMLTQRPVQVPRFVFSEANYYWLYDLNDERDHETLQGLVPRNNPLWDVDREVPQYHSRWHDVAEHWSSMLGPVPSADESLDIIDTRLRPKKKAI